MNPSNDDTTSGILLRFIDQFGSGAEGHSREPLTEVQQMALRSFSTGPIAETDRSSLVSLLAENELAMEQLVEYLKPT